MCEHPFWNKTEKIFCPCGNCPYCRKKKAVEWSMRCVHEIMYHRSSVFITLTYDQEHVPANYSLDHADFQGFIKRLRAQLGDDNHASFRYFMCGEYGTKRKRPHYHALLFGLSFEDAEKYINKCWGKGNVDIGYNVSRQTAAYVAGYVVKKLKTKNYKAEGRKPPYIACSKGIGRNYAIDFVEVYMKKGYCEDAQSDCKYGIPRYYFKVNNVDRGDYYTRFTEEKNEELLNNIFLNTYDYPIMKVLDENFSIEKIGFLKDERDVLMERLSQGLYIKHDGRLYVLSDEGVVRLIQIRRSKNDTIRAKLRERERLDL